MFLIYIYVPSKSTLGSTVGTSRNVIACSVLKQEDSSLNPKIEKLKETIERFFIGDVGDKDEEMEI